MTEPSWLTVEQLIEINVEAVLRTGEYHHVRDSGSLEMACYRPTNCFHYDEIDDLAYLAAQLAYGITTVHAFEQGNKRTAYGAIFAFMSDNGFGFAPPDEERVSDLIVRLSINDDLAVDKLADLISDYAYEL